jgi:hypothetical protein
MIPYKIEDPMNLPAKSMTGALYMEFELILAEAVNETCKIRVPL